MLDIKDIGTKTTIPGWPANTIEGLLDAMERWELDTRLDYSSDPRFDPHEDRKPFRGPAVSCAGTVYVPSLGRNRYLSGPPLYPEHPTAVAFIGNFVGYSFGFYIVTDDRELIARLDKAIAANLARHGHLVAEQPQAGEAPGEGRYLGQLMPLESTQYPWVVMRRTCTRDDQYLGRLPASQAELDEYRKNCGLDPADIYVLQSRMAA